MSTSTAVDGAETTVEHKRATVRPEKAAAVAEIAAAAKAVRGDVIVLCHGGPIALPADAQYVLDRCAIEGFYGASSMERLPTEEAITTQVGKFLDLRLPPGAADARAARTGRGV